MISTYYHWFSSCVLYTIYVTVACHIVCTVIATCWKSEWCMYYVDNVHECGNPGNRKTHWSRFCNPGNRGVGQEMKQLIQLLINLQLASPITTTRPAFVRQLAWECIARVKAIQLCISDLKPSNIGQKMQTSWQVIWGFGSFFWTGGELVFFSFGSADIANFSTSVPQVVNFGIDRFDKVCSCKTDFANSGKSQICQNGQNPELLPMAVTKHTLKLIRTCATAI